MKNLSSRTILPAMLALILTACGGTNNPSTTINVTMTDFTFLPGTFTVPAGQQITLDANNGGAVDHSFVIMKLGHEVSGRFVPADRDNIYWELKLVAPGQSVRETFTAPTEPGVYQIVCSNVGHFEAGMVAKLVVVAQP